MNWKEQVAEFKAALNVEPISISATAIRFGLFGFSGGGKSVTAGILALGITPSPGKIGWIDGEGHRSGWAADVVGELAAKHYGGDPKTWTTRFVAVHLDPPFNPLRVIGAIEKLEEAGCVTIIADCMTQAWDAEGGYLDMKNDEVDRMLSRNPNTTEAKVSSAASAHVKPRTHQKLVNKVVTSRCHLIMVFQGKQKFNMQTKQTNQIETPIQESGMTRTALAVGRVEARDGVGGFCTFAGDGTKYTHPGLKPLLPEGRQLTFKDAEAIAKWTRGDTVPEKPRPQAQSPAPKAATTATRDWMLKGILAAVEQKKVENYAVVTGVIAATQTLNDWPLDQVPTSSAALAALIQKIETFQ